MLLGSLYFRLVFSLIAAVRDYFSVSVSSYRLLESRNQQKSARSPLGLMTVNHISLCANSGLYSNRLRSFLHSFESCDSKSLMANIYTRL